MNSGEHAAYQKPGILRRFFGLLAWTGFVALLSWLTFVYVGHAYAVPTGSMEKTIMTGDRVLAEKVSYYLRDPEPGDIVMFEDPDIPGRLLLKRCIAVGGQTVDINDEDGLVYVDGVALREPYTDGLPTYTLASDVSYPYTVPEGMMWMMGDNRTNSQDSRYFGAVSVASAEARSVAVLWPWATWACWDSLPPLASRGFRPVIGNFCKLCRTRRTNCADALSYTLVILFGRRAPASKG